ncbi:hypothetical protein [Paraburkholderia youngii]
MNIRYATDATLGMLSAHVVSEVAKAPVRWISSRAADTGLSETQPLRTHMGASNRRTVILLQSTGVTWSMLTESLAIPTVIVNGTPIEVDKYLMAALWTADGAHASVMDVAQWRERLRERGDDFASHEAACYYWLCENRAGCPPWAYPK